MNLLKRILTQLAESRRGLGKPLVSRPVPTRSTGHQSFFVPLTAGVVLLRFADSCSASETVKGFRERLNLPRDPEPVLAEILARDEFKEPHSWREYLDDILKRLWEGFLDILEELFGLMPNTGPLKADPDILWSVLTAMLIGIVLLGIIYAARPLYRVISQWTGSKPVPLSHAAGEQSRPVGSGILWEGSQELADEGKYGEALVHLFRFSLTRLDELGRLSYRTGKTNRELLESIRASGSLRDILSEMVPIFNRVRYGDAHCGKIEYEHFLNLCLRAVERK